jgi:hypothetical protein
MSNKDTRCYLEKTAFWGALLAKAPEAMAAVPSAVGGVLKGTGEMVQSLGDVAEKSIGLASAGSVSLGAAAAYVAYKINQIKPSDRDVDRKKFYRDELITRIAQIRRDQAIKAEKNKQTDDKQRSLRLS